MGAPVDEFDVAACHHVSYGTGYDHLVAAAACRDPCSNMHCDADRIAVHQFDLTGMDARSHLQTQGLCTARHGEGCLDCHCGVIEQGEQAVAGGLDLSAVEIPKLLSQ